jgi:hypothetical protein
MCGANYARHGGSSASVALMTYLVVVLLVGGVGTELYGLWTIAVDVRDAASERRTAAQQTGSTHSDPI